MREALRLARLAELEDEVPVGAVVVFENRIIGRGYNKREGLSSPTAHAETIAIENAAHTLNSWRLEKCELFVTLEPCIMCSGVIQQSRIQRIYFGSRDPKAGAVISLYSLLSDERLNHQVEVFEGLLADESAQLLSQFFRRIRLRNQWTRATVDRRRDVRVVEGA